MTRTAAARNGRDGLREENVPTLVWMMNPSPRAITKPHRKSATATARMAVHAPDPVNRRLGTPHILRLRPAGGRERAKRDDEILRSCEVKHGPGYRLRISACRSKS